MFFSESKKRKSKNWEEDDFYDSDEDTFLDRTGTIEKKRLFRMKKSGKDVKAETYESLVSISLDTTYFQLKVQFYRSEICLTWEISYAWLL